MKLRLKKQSCYVVDYANSVFFDFVRQSKTRLKISKIYQMTLNAEYKLLTGGRLMGRSCSIEFLFAEEKDDPLSSHG